MHNENHTTRTQANLEGSSPKHAAINFFVLCIEPRTRAEGRGRPKHVSLICQVSKNNPTKTLGLLSHIIYTHEAASKILLYIPNYLLTSV